MTRRHAASFGRPPRPEAVPDRWGARGPAVPGGAGSRRGRRRRDNSPCWQKALHAVGWHRIGRQAQAPTAQSLPAPQRGEGPAGRGEGLRPRLRDGRSPAPTQAVEPTLHVGRVPRPVQFRRDVPVEAPLVSCRKSLTDQSCTTSSCRRSRWESPAGRNRLHATSAYRGRRCVKVHRCNSKVGCVAPMPAGASKVEEEVEGGAVRQFGER
ncbi:hypothetical protein ES705_31488 [subsurface metagenome]